MNKKNKKSRKKLIKVKAHHRKLRSGKRVPVKSHYRNSINDGANTGIKKRDANLLDLDVLICEDCDQELRNLPIQEDYEVSRSFSKEESEKIVLNRFVNKYPDYFKDPDKYEIHVHEKPGSAMGISLEREYHVIGFLKNRDEKCPFCNKKKISF